MPDIVIGWYQCQNVWLQMFYLKMKSWTATAIFAKISDVKENIFLSSGRSNGVINTLRPRQNGRHFPDDIYLNENAWIAIKISLKLVPKGPINKIPALVQIMAWRRSGYKPLSEPMMVSLLMQICVTQPQWVNHDYTW